MPPLDGITLKLQHAEYTVLYLPFIRSTTGLKADSSSGVEYSGSRGYTSAAVSPRRRRLSWGAKPARVHTQARARGVFGTLDTSW